MCVKVRVTHVYITYICALTISACVLSSVTCPLTHVLRECKGIVRMIYDTYVFHIFAPLESRMCLVECHAYLNTHVVRQCK